MQIASGPPFDILPANMEEELRQLREAVDLLERRVRTLEMPGQGDLSPIFGPLDIKTRNLQQVGRALVDRSTVPQKTRKFYSGC